MLGFCMQEITESCRVCSRASRAPRDVLSDIQRPCVTRSATCTAFPLTFIQSLLPHHYSFFNYFRIFCNILGIISLIICFTKLLVLFCSYFVFQNIIHYKFLFSKNGNFSICHTKLFKMLGHLERAL